MVGLQGHESIALAHPFNKGFERVHKCSTDEEIEKAKSGSLDYLVKDLPTDSANPTSDPKSEVTVKNEEINGDRNPDGDKKDTMVYTTTYYIGLELHEGE